jgi:phage shock protein A
LAAAQDTLKAMRQAQADLEVKVENLEARLEMIEVAKASSSVSIDDSRLARVRGLIDEIGTRVEVAEKLVNADVEYPDQIRLDEPKTQDILEEVTDYFGQDGADEYLVELE